ncbi:MAG: DNA modification methylase [Nitrososphaeraceae archaeon]
MSNKSLNNPTDKKLEIKIKSEYEQLVPPLTPREFTNLKQSIKENNGNSIPIIVTKEGIILDGNNRYKACLELGLEPRIEIQDFSNPLLEKEFIITINLHRRHLNQFQISELGYKLEEIEEQKARMRQLKNLKNVRDTHPISSSLASNDANEQEEEDREGEKGKVSKIIANKIGQSSTKYERNKKIIEQGSEEQKENLREGKESTNKIYNEIVKAQKKEELLKKVKTSLSSLLTQDENNNSNNNSNNFNTYQLLLGDLTEKGKEILEESIDLIFTDPPYSTESIPIYSELESLANRVLKPGGSLVTYVGQHNLPEILDIFTSHNLKYWWPIAVKHTGPTKAFHQRKVFVLWKPLLWFVKGEKLTLPSPVSALNDYLYDYIQSKPPEKILHPWQQSTVEAEHIIKKLTVENQIVLDPLMGSGTTGIAALSLKRRFIGIEKDREKFLIAESRFVDINWY